MRLFNAHGERKYETTELEPRLHGSVMVESR